MRPNALPRRLLWVAAGAVGAGAYLYVRTRMDALRREENSSARSRTPERPRPAPARPAPPSPVPAPTATHTAEPSETAGETELRSFLAGDSWFDEGAWRGIWEREAISDSAAWLSERGLEVLRQSRSSLASQPALLAGCRRRWIVVCRYAGVDSARAAALWEAAA
ncbi:MAG: hypothetical protein ACO3JL_08240 [Myxococcota bacterium]